MKFSRYVILWQYYVCITIHFFLGSMDKNKNLNCLKKNGKTNMLLLCLQNHYALIISLAVYLLKIFVFVSKKYILSKTD